MVFETIDVILLSVNEFIETVYSILKNDNMLALKMLVLLDLIVFCLIWVDFRKIILVFVQFIYMKIIFLFSCVLLIGKMIIKFV